MKLNINILRELSVFKGETRRVVKCSSSSSFCTRSNNNNNNNNMSSKDLMLKESKYSAPNYLPLPVVIAKGKGCKVWDPEGKEYLDLLSGYGTVQTGHCHPKILDVLMKQASTLTHTSRAFYNDVFPEFAEKICKLFQFDMVLPMNTGAHVWDIEGKTYLDFLCGIGSLPLGHSHPKVLKVVKSQACHLSLTSRHLHNNVLPEFMEYLSQYFDYDMVIPMNTGVEAGETAVKVARRWGYLKKNVPQGCALIVFPENNFWGRTTAAISTSTSPAAFENFGPYMPGFGLIPYNDIKCLETVVKHPNVVAFFMEPILGEAGVIIPDHGYLEQVRRLCSENNVLWIADEIQTGLGRTGALLACDHECVKPDLLLLGKGLAAGYMPVSCVLGSKSILSLMTSGTHGSTFGGNPLACRVAMKTLEIIKDEKLAQHACRMGNKFRKLLECSLPKEWVVNIRGKGLMNAIQLNPDLIRAYDFCMKLKEDGLLVKNTDDCTIRLFPPLNIKETEIKQAANIIFTAIQKLRGCI